MTNAALWSMPFERLAEGASFETRGRTITESDVVAFAAQTGDWHPQHADAHWAADGPFGERIAHGMLVLSYAVGLVPLDPERVVALRRIADLVTSLQEVSDQAGLTGFAWTVVNQEDRTVARARVEVLWRRGAPPLSDPFEPATNGFVPIPL
jgi:acyl dehydratase